jgi:hypothetical protein
MHPAVQRVFDKYTFDDLPENGASFYAGGVMIDIPEDRKTMTSNRELLSAYRTVHNVTGAYPVHPTMEEVLDPYRGYYRHALLINRNAPPSFSFLESEAFAARLAERYAAKARGLVHVAVANTPADDRFRMSVVPAIAANENITAVRVIDGVPMPAGIAPYVDKLTRVFHRAATFEQWNDALNQTGGKIATVPGNILFNETLETLPRMEWAEQQKQQWFETSRDKVLRHLEKAEISPALNINGVYYYDRAEQDYIEAKTQFLAEVILSLHETKHLKDRLAAGDESARLPLENEKERLKESLELTQKYPELPLTVEPFTALEYARSRYPRNGNKRIHILTQTIGMMMLKQNDDMTLENKATLWGSRHDYDSSSYLPFVDGEKPGHPEAVESMVSDRIRNLPSEIRTALEETKPAPLVSRPPKPAGM